MGLRAVDPGLLERFTRAAADLEQSAAGCVSTDESVDRDIRGWLDGDEPLNWQSSTGITPDEYFFITTLYGRMNLAGERTMIRRFFEPLFVSAAGRDIAKFRTDLEGYDGLRSPFMKVRLCKLGAILRERGMSMRGYVEELKSLEQKASPEDPMPALDKIVEDHQAAGVKTLSVFVRDCVKGNCFPIDTRVERQLIKHDLPVNERLLVRMCLATGRDPRWTARVFYEAPK
jgi:hypothetical protein